MDEYRADADPAWVSVRNSISAAWPADSSIMAETFLIVPVYVSRHTGNSAAAAAATVIGMETHMVTLCIRYTLDASKLADFEVYARALVQPVERCGGQFAGYYLPTKIAGPTNTATGFIDFPDLAAYERYREKLMCDPDAVACLREAEAAGCILNEDRSFVRRISA